MCRSASAPVRRALVAVLLLAAAMTAVPAAQQPGAPAAGQFEGAPAQAAPEIGPFDDFDAALVRLPLAAALGTALALRPRRRGTPKRDPAVVQTQIVLAVVGAVIMLIVGASLARAFGIVGAASLIRYRSKIEDPKDAVVMLSALAVGLAAGVGLYGVAIFSTGFLVAALGIIESFEKGMKRFDLHIRAGDDTDAQRAAFEEVLRGFGLKYDLRTSSDEEVCYDVQVPIETRIDRISNAILRLDPEGRSSVEWIDKKKAK